MIHLKRERERAEISQAELAKKAGVAQQTISAIETGERRNPGIETMRLLAEALGCRLTDLCGPDDEKRQR